MAAETDLLIAPLRCPLDKTHLNPWEPWLYESGDELYPVLCGTPILQPEVGRFLQSERSNIARGMAEFQADPDSLDWYFSRYGALGRENPLPLDTEIAGEGYPGFWQAVDLPAFVRDLTREPPEQRILDQLPAQPFRMGLDLGCGQGGMTQRMAARCERVWGLESNAYLAMLANHQLARPEIAVNYWVPESGVRHARFQKPVVTNALVVCGDAALAPFQDGLFDWIHAGHLLDLHPDPVAVLEEIARLLQPGGQLSLASPWDFDEEDHFEGVLEFLKHYFKTGWSTDGIPWLRWNHKRRFVLHEDWLWLGERL